MVNQQWRNDCDNDFKSNLVLMLKLAWYGPKYGDRYWISDYNWYEEQSSREM